MNFSTTRFRPQVAFTLSGDLITFSVYQSSGQRKGAKIQAPADFWRATPFHARQATPGHQTLFPLGFRCGYRLLQHIHVGDILQPLAINRLSITLNHSGVRSDAPQPNTNLILSPTTALVIPFFISIFTFTPYSPLTAKSYTFVSQFRIRQSEPSRKPSPPLVGRVVPNAPHAPPHPPSTICHRPPSPYGRIPCVHSYALPPSTPETRAASP